ncbi:MAG TPA: hypothetical protein VHD38_02350 [Candidatus Paceibacterota bacterium]|nr:hypothetical protein [Candidatus Paceibacterota bacterium]
MTIAASETIESSGKDDKGEKHDKGPKFTTCAKPKPRFPQWGTPVDAKGIKELIDILKDEGVSSADWVDTALRECDKLVAKFAGTQDNPTTENGICWWKAYYYTLPGGAEAALLVPVLSRIDECGVHLYVRGVNGSYPHKEIQALLRELFHCIED